MKLDVQNLNRREFLRLFGAALAMPWAGLDWPGEPDPVHPTGWGRVTLPSIWAYDRPHPDGEKVQSIPGNTVIKIHKSASTQGLLPHNFVWNLTELGWVYSSWIQPVKNQLNEVRRDVPEGGFWAQVTVPYVALRIRPDDEARLRYLLYYSSVHQVVAHVEDARGESWYQLRDDQSPALPEYARAEALRPIPRQEMLPISPFVKDKIIEVSTRYQMLYAYENGRLVFSARCATGTSFYLGKLGWVNYRTPRGTHRVIRKRPSRHMVGGFGRSDYFDLPGVPFCTYFTGSGVAIHGTYWHNDFGHPRSHGCVNVLDDEAQWVYRWTQPPATYEDVSLEVKEGGTQIIVT